MISGVVFDYGSTLIRFDADPDAVRPIAHRELSAALREAGYHYPEEPFQKRFQRNLDEYNHRRGKDNLETTAAMVLVETLAQEGLPPLSGDVLPRVLSRMYRVYEAHWHLYPDTHSALKQIQGMGLRMALLSNASDAANVWQMLLNHKLDNLFDPVVISAAVGIRKPDPRPFRMVLDPWRLPAGETVMVGDQLGMDVLGAQTVGMRSIWLRTEQHAPSNRAHYGKIHPDAEADHIGEVPDILRRWQSEIAVK